MQLHRSVKPKLERWWNMIFKYLCSFDAHFYVRVPLCESNSYHGNNGKSFYFALNLSEIKNSAKTKLFDE